VTRDLTPGQRTLLYKFLDGVTGLESAPPTMDVAASGPPPRDFHKLSRATRSK
jgi:hypothetical protein